LGRIRHIGDGAARMAEPLEPTQAQIRQRAYELFEERTRKHGGDTEDWLAAEQQLRAAAFENVMRAIVDRRTVTSRKTRLHSKNSAGASLA